MSVDYKSSFLGFEVAVEVARPAVGQFFEFLNLF